MIKGLSIGVVALAAAFTAATPGFGQSVLQVSVTAGGATSTVAAGGSVALTATGIGQPVLASVTVLYTGSATATITSVSITGTTEMSLAPAPAFPITLSPNGSTNFTVQYDSTTGNTANGQVSVNFTENSQASSFEFGLTGTSPLLAFSYYFAPAGALTNVNSGGTIGFPATNVGSTSIAVMTVLNLGTATGSVQSVTLSGSAFQLSGSTAPTQLAPGQQTSFNVTFAPQAVGTNQGLLVVGLSNASASFTLTGTGTSSSFTFTYTLSDGNIHPLTNGTVITYPSVDINGTSTATIAILNQGTGAGTLTSISVSGAAFRLTGVPLLPATIGAGQNLQFQIVFAPTQSGAYSGTFSIVLAGSTVSGSLTASTSPSNLTASYTLSNGIAGPLSNGATVVFPSVDINGTTTATVVISNSGTGTGTVSSITLSGTGFRLTGVPVLPANVAPAQNLQFSIVFAPTQTGAFTGSLQINMTGVSITASLSASTSSSTFAVTYTLSDGIPHSLTNGGTIVFPSVDINGTTTATVVISNSGAGTGTVSGISLSATGFRLTGVPVLPANVAPTQSLQFAIVFAPTQSGAFTGSFQITATGVSITGALFASTTTPTLAVTYTLSDGIPHTLSNGATVVFPSVDINATTTATVVISNSGTGTGTVSGITLSGTGFRLTGVPVLPANVAPTQSLQFAIVFAPTQSGAFTGSFQINMTGVSITATLSGSTTAPSFTVTYTLANGNANILSNGTTINFPAVNINTTATATIDIVNQGTGAGSVTAVSVAGTGFQVTALAALPATVAVGQDFHFGIAFSPTQAGSFSGTYSITVGGISISGALAGSTSPPSFSVAYVDPSTNNVIALQNGATLSFPNTLAGSVSNITMLAINSGSGTGFLNSIALGGNSPSIFQILNQPSLPASVPPAQQVSFGVRFSPLQQQTFSATLILNLSGQTVTINLAAQGTGPQYTYTWSNATGTTAVAPGGTIAIPNTNVGQTSSVTILVSNTGTGNGQVSVLAVSGQGLSITNPPALPFTLLPQGSQSFTLNFAPTQPSAVTGTLTIGTDTFNVTATGIGSLLTYSYTNTASTVSVAVGGVVIFQPTPVAGSASLTFSIQNTGTSGATISSINLAAASTVFSLQQLPNLPTTLNPGGTITFSANFVPNSLGSLTATLLVNNNAFTLSGTGTQPASLPAYQFQGPSGTEPAAQQPSIGLILSAPYPLALQGTLTLTFTSAVFTDDPSIQFATGGRTVTFSIPANSTQALFSGGATSIPLQTGTTEGTILITPSFSMQNGFDLTPSPPTSLTLMIPPSVAQLTSESVTSETLSSFTVILSGYATTHALKQLNIQITPKQSGTFSTTNLTIDVTSASSAWFQSTASQPYGGAFLIAIPFVLSNGSSTDDLVHLLQSLTITATNGVGASSSILVPIP